MARSWSQRWQRVRGELTMTDLMLDVSGKVLAAVGFGAIFARHLASCAWGLIGFGLILSATIKAKYWKRFWA